MRVYLPATSRLLRELLDRGVIGPAPLTAFAVTPGLREWYRDGSPDVPGDPDEIEDLEYAAMAEAARASLRLLQADSETARRRVVIALDVAAGQVEVRDDLDRGVVRLRDEIEWVAVVSVHVDDADAEAVIAAAAGAVDAADLGDPDANDTVDDAEGFELSWYAAQEIAGWLDALPSG